MKGYMTSWRAAVKPSDKTGIATLTLGHKEVKFKMNNFQQYLDLCAIIDTAVSKAEERTRISIFEHMNSYNKW
jgi:hypothetical protein